MSNELLREAWKEICFPLLDKYFQDLWTKRNAENNWPARSIFSDLVKPFKVTKKETSEIQLMCVVPPTPSFWSAIISMYVLFARKTFKNHQRACKIFLEELQAAKFNVRNLTDNFAVFKWLQESMVGWEGKERNDKNLFLQDPVMCCALLHRDMLIVCGTLKEEEVERVDSKLVWHYEEKYAKISNRLETNDRQGKGVGEHCVEGERGLGSGDGNGLLGGAHHGTPEIGPGLGVLITLPDLRPGDIDPLHGERVERVTCGHESVGPDWRDCVHRCGVQAEDPLEKC